MPKLKTLACLALLLAAGACDSRRGMTVRTFELHRLSNEEAITLLTPYIGEGGFLSGKNRLLTVRERPEQLDSVAAILRRYDGTPPVVSLRFQVVEAGDFAGGDSSVAQVESTLRELFRYRGYRLLGELTVQAMEGTRFSQEQNGLRVSGFVREVTATGPDARVTIDVSVSTGDTEVATSVSGTPGKTMIIGSQKGRADGGALVAAVRPEIVASRH
jgi:hypothetical protein